MIINHNISAINAHRQLKFNSWAVDKDIEKLSKSDVMQLFYGRPITRRNQQNVGLSLADLANEGGEIHVEADGSSQPSILRIVGGDLSISALLVHSLWTWYGPAL